MTTSGYKHFLLKTMVLYRKWKTHDQNIFLKTSKMPEKWENEFDTHSQDFLFKLQLTAKYCNNIS